MIGLERRDFLCGVGALAFAAPAAGPQAPNGDAALAALLDEVSADRRGPRPDRLPDYSAAGAEARAGRLRDQLRRLDVVRKGSLDPMSRETSDLLQWDLTTELRLQEYYWLDFPLSPYTSDLSSALGRLPDVEFADEADLDRYLSLLHDVPRVIGDLQTKLKGQIERGIATHVEQVASVTAMLRGTLSAAKDRFGVAQSRLSRIDPARAAAFQAEAQRIIAAEDAPALDALIKFLAVDYRASTDGKIGVWRLPHGEEYFAFLLAYRAAGDITPREAHARALQDVADSERELTALRRDLGFTGSREAFHNHLLTDDRWIAKSADDVAARFDAAIRRIEPHLKDYFAHLPAAPYGVAPVAPELEATFVNGYYQEPGPGSLKGLYRFNAGHLETTSWVWAAPLIYHELMPGHHLQYSSLRESTVLPPYRKFFFASAPVEGWGEYARGLAEEMDLYRDDPYSLYASKLMDQRFAVLAVGDTGMHLERWSLDKTTDYFAINPLIRPTSRRRLALAYGIDFPGDSMAYWHGRHEFKRLRRKAEAGLGPRFDKRTFHDCLLGGGNLPFKVMEARVDRWMKTQA